MRLPVDHDVLDELDPGSLVADRYQAQLVLLVLVLVAKGTGPRMRILYVHKGEDPGKMRRRVVDINIAAVVGVPVQEATGHPVALCRRAGVESRRLSLVQGDQLAGIPGVGSAHGGAETSGSVNPHVHGMIVGVPATGLLVDMVVGRWRIGRHSPGDGVGDPRRL